MRSIVHKIPRFLALTLVTLAVIDQLRRPRGQRDLHGEVLFVPYDFRPPSLRRVRQAWWDPASSRIFTPQVLGMGWSLNLGRLYQLARGRLAGPTR